MDRIMIATDGSRSAKRALDAAAILAKRLKGELTVITVGGTISATDLTRLMRGTDDVDQALNALAKKILDNACKRAKSIGVRRIKRQSKTGDAATAILDAARRARTDFLVVGRHGFGSLTGWLLGSISQKIMSLAPCKVIVVP
jgi:nucleotide-binding universal stress UspA family protein